MVSSKFVRLSIQWYLGYKKYVSAVQMRQNNPWQFIRMVFLGNYDDAVFQSWNRQEKLVAGSQTRTQWKRTSQGGIWKCLAAW